MSGEKKFPRGMLFVAIFLEVLLFFLVVSGKIQDRWTTYIAQKQHVGDLTAEFSGWVTAQLRKGEKVSFYRTQPDSVAKISTLHGDMWFSATGKVRACAEVDDTTKVLYKPDTLVTRTPRMLVVSIRTQYKTRSLCRWYVVAPALPRKPALEIKRLPYGVYSDPYT